MKSGFLFLIFILGCYLHLNGQNTTTIVFTDERILIDGELNERSWSNSKAADDFWQYFPSDSVKAAYQTEIRFLYDSRNVYIGIKCYSPGNNYIIPSLQRDFRAGGNDNITLIIDPFNDRINAFIFGTNPMGVQREGLISGGGASIENFSVAWDNKWRSEAVIHDGYWTAEMAIPLNVLRFNPGIDKWSFNAYRFDTQSNERSSWNRIPRNQWIFNLAFMGDLLWDKAPEAAPTGGTSIIPYATTGFSRNFETDKRPNIQYNFGGDAKIAVSPSLNLDLTFNPDFSQVEVDQQVTNIDRFEIFFPERRQFFLENADLFGSFGNERINPFFSRRIGVSQDTLTGNAIQNTIYGGARLSGKLNENLRLGLLTMQTASDPANGLPDYNYSILSLQRRMYSRSNIGFIMVNKQSFSNLPSNSDFDKFNRVVGLDYNLATDDNTWTGKAFLHRSIGVSNSANPYAQGSSLRYNTRKLFVEWNQEYVGEGYDAQVGFVPRLNYLRINPSGGLMFYQKEGLFNQHGPQVNINMLWTPGIGKTDQVSIFSYESEMRNNSRVTTQLRNDYVFLIDAFDPTGTDSRALEGRTDYQFTSFTFSYRSNEQRAFVYSFRPVVGEYYNGMRAGVNGELSYRFQPYAILSMNYGYNYFSMPYLDKYRQNFLLGPRLELTLNKELFLTSVVQYNSQITNLNVNARLQWRFAPVSDLFIVYTDNYFVDYVNDPSSRFIQDIRNRSLVAKVTYWLNI